MPDLSAAYASLALELQEASNASSTLTHGDIQSKLRDAVSAAHRGSDSYGYYLDHAGDDESGDVMYRSNGVTKRAPYEVNKPSDGSAPTVSIAHDAAETVQPRTIYEPVCDEDDHYAAMEEAMVRKEKLYTTLPLYERVIAKTERDNMDSGDFAGKNRSYPINKPEDVGAAAHALGRAGSDNFAPNKIKANIIAIAKRKGWTSSLPKAWQGGSDAKESRRQAARATSALKLVESVADLDFSTLLREGAGDGAAASMYRTNYPIRIISPGVGSTAHYSEAMLKKAVEAGKFAPGLMMYWNHPTAAQEASRPEGDLDDLAAITSKPGVWMDAGPKGPGVYAEAKVMADYAQKVQERAPHIGLSIRAGGTGSGRLVEGKPDLASIDYVESVDYVTKAGRGGLALAEAAREAGLLEEVSDMDAAELKRLQEGLASNTAATTRLLEGEMRRAAIDIGIDTLKSMNLPGASKQRAVEAVLERPLPKTADGDIDRAKLVEAFQNQAKAEGTFLESLTGRKGVTNMGAPAAGTAPAAAAAATAAEEADREKKRDEAYLKIFESLTKSKTGGKFAFVGRVDEEAIDEEVFQ